MAHVRASIIIARNRWLKEKHGPAAVEAVLGALGRHEMEIRAAVSPTLWVSFDASVAMNVEIDRRFGRGDLALCTELGSYAARVNLPTLYRIFFRIGSVDYILSKSAAVWSAHYDSGRAHTQTFKGGARVTIEDFATPHRALCLSVLGWLRETVKLTGAELTSSDEVQCRLRGDRVCVFEGSYH